MSVIVTAGVPNEHLHFKGAIFQLKNSIKEFGMHFFVCFKITPCYQKSIPGVVYQNQSVTVALILIGDSVSKMSILQLYYLT